MTRRKREPLSTVVVVRDTVSFVLAWVLIFQQALFVPPSQVNEAFLFLAASLVGVPMGAEAVSQLRSLGVFTSRGDSREESSASSSSSSSIFDKDTR